MGSEKAPIVLETVMICFFCPRRRRGRKPMVERATPYTLVWMSSSNCSMELYGRSAWERRSGEGTRRRVSLRLRGEQGGAVDGHSSVVNKSIETIR